MISSLSMLAGVTQAAAGQRTAGQRSGVSRSETTNATEKGRTAARSQVGNSAENSSNNSSSNNSIVPSGLTMKETFLTLLVAQIKNQNPLNPADGTEFLSQLAQFTQVEQLISIREELETMGQQNQALSAAANEVSLR